MIIAEVARGNLTAEVSAIAKPLPDNSFHGAAGPSPT